MKRIFSLVLVAVMLLSTALIINILATASTGVDFEYHNEDGGAVITGYTGHSLFIDVPESLGGVPVVAVESLAFADSVNIETVKFPSTVVRIGDDIFSGCFKLTQISIDSSKYKSIDGALFTADGAKLICYPAGKGASTYSVPAGVTEIGDGAFTGNTNLEEIGLPNGLNLIGDAAFASLSKLKNIVLPETVSQIGDYAFSDCVGLIKFTLPSGTDSLGACVFSGCTAIESFNVSGENKNFTARDGVIFTKDLSMLRYYPIAKITPTLIVPAQTRIIDGNAAAGNAYLRRVTLGENVLFVSDGAFYGCTSLNFVTIADGIINIGSEAFKGCTGVTLIGKKYSYTHLYALRYGFSFMDSAQGKLGDTDNNGDINIMDALSIFKCISGKLPGFEGAQFLRSDINGDGKITIIDALCIFKHISGKELIG